MKNPLRQDLVMRPATTPCYRPPQLMYRLFSVQLPPRLLCLILTCSHASVRFDVALFMELPLEQHAARNSCGLIYAGMGS
jgi:hypothetical protein